VRDERWKAKASVLREMVRHHVEVEENAMFPKAHKLFSDSEAQQLASQFEDQKRI
jgi:hemerythrin-like domain-containing protein